MNLAILTASERWLLLGVGIVFAAVAIILRWKMDGNRSVVVTIVVAAVAVAVLIIERVVAFMVNLSAPPASDFNEFRWVLLAPWGRFGLAFGVLVVSVIVVLGWRASMRLPSPWQRATLIGLRTASACAALVLFLQPAIELRQVAREPNRVAILVDSSLSMSLQDEPGGPRRIDRARALLDRSTEALERWQSEHRIDFFEFSETLVPSAETTAATTAPTGQATMMRLALEQVRSRYDGRELAGIVLISDGVATGGFADEAGAGAVQDFLHSLDTRIHTVWVGRPGLKDIAIARVFADEFAFVRTVVRIEAVIRSTGYGLRRIPVTLSSEGQALKHKWIEVGPDTIETKVVFELSPPKVGKFVFELSTPVAADEAVAENNSRSFVLRVVRDKIRVLQVAGQPSWDVHALRRMLKQNPNVDLISFFILRTIDDQSAVPNSEMSLIPFPTRELFQQELPSFDLIVMQNFDFGPYGIGAYLENIRSYVEQGGGLVMLGGQLSFSSGGYAGTPVAAALPVVLEPGFQSSRDLLDTSLFRPELTLQGQGHPVTSLRYEPADNAAVWKALPQLEGVNILGGVKPEATVLATHPRLRMRTGEPMPFITVGEYGEGRSLAVTTDSLWKWGFIAAAQPGDDGRYYTKFWENAIRWLIQDPELRYLHIDSDAVEYTPGSPIRLDVRLLKRDYTPLSGGEVRVEVHRGADPTRTEAIASETLRVGEGGNGTYELSGLKPGIYRAKARAEISGKEELATDIFLVREGTAELDQPAADDSLLRQLAEATGGTYLGDASELPSDLPFEEPRVVRVDHRADVELWSRPSLFFLALIFLGFDWILRQRSGYL